VLVREFPITALRQFDQATARQRSVLATPRWSRLCDLGVPAFLVPASAGGLGLNDVDLVGVFEEAGWTALPEPLLETAGLAAPMLATLLPTPAAANALGNLLNQNALVAVGGIDVSGVGPTSPTSVSADGMLRTPRVGGARDATVYLLACRDPDSGWQLHVVPAEACTVHPTPTLDQSRDLSTVHWPLSADSLLAYGVAAEVSVGLLADRAAAGSAAFLIGLADRMITMAADHATERHRFGQSVGRGETALTHWLVDAKVKLEFARPAVYRAAWSLATAQPTVSHDASMAKAMASDAADLAARVALQVHGAAAYPAAADLHLFAKRTWALSRSWGDAVTHRQLVLALARRAPVSTRPR
jgi:alkylation response protein AidB-like acyl-CoA dehydrogenase